MESKSKSESNEAPHELKLREDIGSLVQNVQNYQTYVK